MMKRASRNRNRRFHKRTPGRWSGSVALRLIVSAIGTIVFHGSASGQVSGGSSLQNPQTNLVPVGPPPATYPQSSYGSFDPYATTPYGGAGIGPPVGVSAPTTPYPNSNFPSAGLSGSSPFGGLFSQPASSPMPSNFGAPVQSPVYGAPAFQYDNPNVYGAPPTYGGAPGYGTPPPMFPDTIYPSGSPSTLFPEGLIGGTVFPGMSGGEGYSAYQLFRGPRFRYGYVGFGDEPDDLNMNDIDVSVVFAFQNFLYSNQPLFVVPSFSLHLWDGPKSSAKGADLPGSAYSAFLDVGWNSDPNQMFSTELGVRVGAFTDFDTFDSESIRVLGKALVSFRLTPTSTLKGGVYYLDRNDLKLVPAGGVLCQPNPLTRIDLFFPQPKYARYARTIGTQDVWWYFSGDYGGGAWTITRANGQEDSIDINDIRAIMGLEWGRSDEIRAGRRLGFAEIGYVFNREVNYQRSPANDLDLDDGIMFRVGIGY